jgi:S1-C subfamily serine protease
MRPEEFGQRESEAVTNEKLGITVETLSSRSARRYNLDEQDEGAVITQVKQGSEAESLGLRPGDLVTAVVIEGKRQAILSAEDFAERVTPETLANGLNLIVRTRDGSRHLFLQFD